MRNSLIFGGVDSADFGIYITGKAVFNAPKRVVDKIAVPGKNGLLMIDQGRYENITVDYPAFAFGKNRKEFKEKLEAFRNAIVSQAGYQRLADTYNPEEYRMALFSEGLDVDPGPYGGSGKFTLSFDCKPQRFLVSGEQEIEVDSGDTLINPTLFNAQPFLEIKGAGDIYINGNTIGIDYLPIGDIKISSGGSSMQNPQTITLNTSPLNPGDSIYTDGLYGGIPCTATWQINADSNYDSVEVVSGTCHLLLGGSDFNALHRPDYASIQLAYGTACQHTDSAVVKVYIGNDTTTITFDLTISYDGASTITLTRAAAVSGQHITRTLARYCGIPAWRANSTKLGSPDPLYIDLELGEAYGEQSGVLLQYNDHVTFPLTLPVLKPGTNRISYSNTITNLKVKPRWWKI